jgi:hypothetical protein
MGDADRLARHGHDLMGPAGLEPGLRRSTSASGGDRTVTAICHAEPVARVVDGSEQQRGVRVVLDRIAVWAGRGKSDEVQLDEVAEWLAWASPAYGRAPWCSTRHRRSCSRSSYGSTACAGRVHVPCSRGPCERRRDCLGRVSPRFAYASGTVRPDMRRRRLNVHSPGSTKGRPDENCSVEAARRERGHAGVASVFDD